MTKHTPGPWTVRTRREHGSYCYEGGGAHATIASPSTGVFVAEAKCGPKMAEANAARIVACVNALDGIDDPEAFMGEVAALIAIAAGLSTLVDGWGGLSTHAVEINAVGSGATALLAKLPTEDN